MVIKVNFKSLAIAIAAILIAWLTAAGTIQNYIHFAGELNEMAFCFLAFCIGLGSLIFSFEKVK